MFMGSDGCINLEARGERGREERAEQGRRGEQRGAGVIFCGMRGQQDGAGAGRQPAAAHPHPQITLAVAGGRSLAIVPAASRLGTPLAAFGADSRVPSTPAPAEEGGAGVDRERGMSGR